MPSVRAASLEQPRQRMDACLADAAVTQDVRRHLVHDAMYKNIFLTVAMAKPLSWCEKTGRLLDLIQPTPLLTTKPMVVSFVSSQPIAFQSTPLDLGQFVKFAGCIFQS
jgi:hypothetical protein